MEENKKKSRKGKKVALFIGGTLLMAVVGYVAYKKCPVVGGFINFKIEKPVNMGGCCVSCT